MSAPFLWTGFSDYSYSTMEFNGLISASHMSLPEAGYGSEEGQLGSEISGAVSGITTPGASRLQASQLQERSATMQRLHVEGAIIVWIRCPVQIRRQMQTEITSKMHPIQQIIRSIRRRLMNLAASTRLMRPLEVRTPRGATKIAPPQAISGMIPPFLLDPCSM